MSADDELRLYTIQLPSDLSEIVWTVIRGFSPGRIRRIEWIGLKPLYTVELSDKERTFLTLKFTRGEIVITPYTGTDLQTYQGYAFDKDSHE